MFLAPFHIFLSILHGFLAVVRIKTFRNICTFAKFGTSLSCNERVPYKKTMPGFIEGL